MRAPMCKILSRVAIKVSGDLVEFVQFERD